MNQSVIVEAEGAPSVPKEQHPTGDRSILESKLQPSLLAIFDCWEKSGPACKVAKDGTVKVQVWLTESSAAVLEQLKAAGFVPLGTAPNEKVISGRLPAARLLDLARIGAVRFVSPVTK